MGRPKVALFTYPLAMRGEFSKEDEAYTGTLAHFHTYTTMYVYTYICTGSPTYPYV